MAESPDTSDTQQDEDMNGARGMGTAVMSATQDAADMARNTAQRAAERLPEAVAGVQVAATETQRRLERAAQRSDCWSGTSFSLGLAVGLFLSGANRFLVALAVAPAAAMALTMFGRDQEESTAGTPIREPPTDAKRDGYWQRQLLARGTAQTTQRSAPGSTPGALPDVRGCPDLCQAVAGSGVAVSGSAPASVVVVVVVDEP